MFTVVKVLFLLFFFLPTTVVRARVVGPHPLVFAHVPRVRRIDVIPSSDDITAIFCVARLFGREAEIMSRRKRDRFAHVRIPSCALRPLDGRDHVRASSGPGTDHSTRSAFSRRLRSDAKLRIDRAPSCTTTIRSGRRGRFARD